jgi:anaerobic selenocysteine-containing dehydrogenase
MITNGDVVTVVTPVGEFVGRFEGESAEGVKLNSPRMLVQNQQGMGFAPGVSITGKQEPEEVTFRNVVFITDTQQEIAKAYQSNVSKIMLT